MVYELQYHTTPTTSSFKDHGASLTDIPFLECTEGSRCREAIDARGVKIPHQNNGDAFRRRAERTGKIMWGWPYT